MLNMETYRRTSIHSTHMFINSNNNKDLKLQNHVLVWNFTDWDALSSLVIITVSSYMENVDQYTEQK